MSECYSRSKLSKMQRSGYEPFEVQGPLIRDGREKQHMCFIHVVEIHKRTGRLLQQLLFVVFLGADYFRITFQTNFNVFPVYMEVCS